MLLETEWRDRGGRTRGSLTSPEVNAVVDKIMQHIEETPAGGSASPSTGALFDFVDGYLVGGVHPPSVLLWPLRRPISEAWPQVRGIVQAARNEQNAAKVFVGWWTDGDVLFIEVSQHFTMESRAITAARKRGEIALYDVANGKDIRL